MFQSKTRNFFDYIKMFTVKLHLVENENMNNSLNLDVRDIIIKILNYIFEKGKHEYIEIENLKYNILSKVYDLNTEDLQDLKDKITYDFYMKAIEKINDEVIHNVLKYVIYLPLSKNILIEVINYIYYSIENKMEGL